MPSGLKRYQQAHHLHFISFTCFHRAAFLQRADVGDVVVLNPAVLFWQARYYDFNVWSEHKRVEKLRYIHRNPVKRGLVEKPEDWRWSSFRHYVTGEESVVEIESEWTARKRERMGIYPKIRRRLSA